MFACLKESATKGRERERKKERQTTTNQQYVTQNFVSVFVDAGYRDTRGERDKERTCGRTFHHRPKKFNKRCTHKYRHIEICTSHIHIHTPFY